MESSTVALVDGTPGPLYQHKALDLKKKVLRLLRVLPTLEAGVIQCELCIYDFASATEVGYNALSYEWGPYEPPFFWILIDGGYLQVRHNLYKLLQFAYSKLQSDEVLGGYIWIDAVCIDQENLSERGHQVKQMGEVYNCANTVLVWLGANHSQTVDAVADHLHQLAVETKDFQATDGSPQPDRGGCMERARRLLLDHSSISLALEEILSRTYWTRMWIVQELLLSRNARLILGTHVFPWNMFKLVFHDSRLSMSAKVSRYQGITCARALARAQVQGLEDLTQRIVCEMVEVLHGSTCSDTRDRVYAVLSLITDGQWFPVDYSRTKEAVFCSAILASYVSAPRDWKANSGSRSIAQQYTHFKLRIPQMRNLSGIGRVAIALAISYSALDTYLTLHPDIGSDTVIKLYATRRHDPHFGEIFIEHRYKEDNACDWYDRIEFVFRVHQGEQHITQEKTDCEVHVFWSPCDPLSTAETRQLHETLHLDDPCIFGTNYCSVSFRTFTALGAVLHEFARLKA